MNQRGNRKWMSKAAWIQETSSAMTRHFQLIRKPSIKMVHSSSIDVKSRLFFFFLCLVSSRFQRWLSFKFKRWEIEITSSAHNQRLHISNILALSRQNGNFQIEEKRDLRQDLYIHIHTVLRRERRSCEFDICSFSFACNAKWKEIKW